MKIGQKIEVQCWQAVYHVTILGIYENGISGDYKVYRGSSGDINKDARLCKRGHWPWRDIQSIRVQRG